MIEQLPIGILDSNCCLLYTPGAGQAVIVDPGFADPAALHNKLRALQAQPCLVLNTHGHFDHSAGNAYLVNKTVHLGIHPLDRSLLMDGGGGIPFGFRVRPSPEPTLELINGLELRIGALHIRVIHTPGHTPGSVCLYVPDDEALITGDTLFEGNVGRTDLPGGDPRALTTSLISLLNLPLNTRIFPGHGPGSTLQRELRMNPWLRRLRPGPALE